MLSNRNDLLYRIVLDWHNSPFFLNRKRRLAAIQLFRLDWHGSCIDDRGCRRHMRRRAGVGCRYAEVVDMEASTVKHSQPVFFMIATGWLISVGGLAYMWQLLT